MELKAFTVPHGYLFRFHLDATKLIPDPSLPVPQKGETDTRSLIPDPDWVVEYTWGKEEPPYTQAEWLVKYKAEALLLAELELRRRQPPVELEV